MFNYSFIIIIYDNQENEDASLLIIEMKIQQKFQMSW